MVEINPNPNTSISQEEKKINEDILIYYPEQDSNKLYMIDPVSCKAREAIILTKGKFFKQVEIWSIGSRIFVFGGRIASQPRKEAFEIDLRKKEFIAKANMKVAKFAISIVSYLNEIFLLGGYNGKQTFKECDSYNIIDNTYSALPPLPEAQSPVALMNTSLFLIGFFSL